ncbi:MAG TPA: hypothetical protein PKB14_16825 [Rubrivivax sp.]|nr:hypothetical protein [Rubrivivax sp.]
MIQLDTPAVLARIFAGDRSPPGAFWPQTFVASRLLEYEVFHRVHARAAASPHGAAARQLVDRANLIEMSAEVLGRAWLPFARSTQPVRTLVQCSTLCGTRENRWICRPG